ncbi:MAG TPA: TrmH family RNA methyltransferase [Spirochaetia bacterium]|nr:TrmH family RNA methyltransferase [Spirochaetia bacterium]
MFALKKLGELSLKTRLRKVARILQAAEAELAGTGRCDLEYLHELARLLLRDTSAFIREDAAFLEQQLSTAAVDRERVLRRLNILRNDILRELHAEPAEWDFIDPESGRLSRAGVAVRPLRVYLEDVRSPFNVGSIFRTAEAFGAEQILISPRTPAPTHPRAIRAAMKAEHALPWDVTGLESLSGSEGVFALELGGTPLDQFTFPCPGIVLLGSEELGLSPEALRLADSGSGRVSIPLVGAKKSLNVAVAFGILMHAWRFSLHHP